MDNLTEVKDLDTENLFLQTYLEIIMSGDKLLEVEPVGSNCLLSAFSFGFHRAFLPPSFRVYSYDNSGIMKPLEQKFQV